MTESSKRFVFKSEMPYPAPEYTIEWDKYGGVVVTIGRCRFDGVGMVTLKFRADEIPMLISELQRLVEFMSYDGLLKIKETEEDREDEDRGTEGCTQPG